jgi:hypothetical protein
MYYIDICLPFGEKQTDKQTINLLYLLQKAKRRDYLSKLCFFVKKKRLYYEKTYI